MALHSPDVFVIVEEEASEDVDGQHLATTEHCIIDLAITEEAIAFHGEITGPTLKT